MIKLIDNSASAGCNFTYCDHFPGQDRNIILLMKHYLTDSYSQHILEKVFSEIIELDLEDLAEEKIEPVLREFFVELNWRLYTLYGQRPELERGISLVLGIMERDRMYVVQFGRYFMGIISDQGFKLIGRKWENLSVKSLGEINLLGNKDHDINVKVHKFTIPMNSYFIVLGSNAGMKLQELGFHPLSITEYLNRLKESEQFGYVLLRNWEYKAHNINPWIRKRRVNRTGLILLILIIISAAYVYYGRNLIDDVFSRIRFTGKEFTRNDIKQQFFLLQEEAQDLLNQLSEQDVNIGLIPEQKIELESLWEIKLSQEISTTPCVDYKRIYTSSENFLYSIEKSEKSILWQKRFTAKVEVLRLVDANRVLVGLANGILYCLNRDSGDEIWHQESFAETAEAENCRIVQISLNEYRQLEDSMLLMYKGSMLQLSKVRSGEKVAEYDNKEVIDFVSDYDLLESSVYLVAGKKIKKIKIKAIN